MSPSPTEGVPTGTQGDTTQLIPSPIAIAADMLTTATTSPVDWVSSRLGETLWSAQQRIALSVRDHRYTAVPSCYGAGKSYLASRLVAWWIDTHPVGQTVVVTTAPTGAQVKAILWKEIRRAHMRGQLRGKILQSAEWKIGDQLVAFGRKPADHNQAAFQGIHENHVLIVFDEAAGVPPDLWEAANGLMTNPDARFLAIGNPDSRATEFAAVCDPAHPLGWQVHRISAFDTPNMTGEPVPADVSRGLVSTMWVNERRIEWNQDGDGSDPRWVSKVLGEFPVDDELGVVPWSAIVACRHVDLPDSGVRQMGVDVGGGSDATTAWARVGSRVVPAVSFRSDDPTETARRLLEAIVLHQPDVVCVDTVGIGWGVAGRLAEYGTAGNHQARVVGVNVGSSPTDPTRFPKLRDELWWDIGRQLSQDRAWDLSQVDDDVARQLAAPRWKPDAAGRIKVEPKTDTIKRLGRSPDDADAILLAFHQPKAVAANTETTSTDGNVDPYKADRPPSVFDNPR